MSDVRQQLPRTWRPVRSRVVALLTALAVETGALALALTLPSSFHGGDRVAIVVMASCVTAVLLVLARPRLAADRDGVTVVNLLRSRRLAWTEILGVQLAETESWASFDLADGTALPVLAVQTADGPRFRRAVDELRQLVEALSTSEQPE